jgi:hypothetical protein
VFDLKSLGRHSRESGNLRFAALTEIPVFAGMPNGGEGR